MELLTYRAVFFIFAVVLTACVSMCAVGSATGRAVGVTVATGNDSTR